MPKQSTLVKIIPSPEGEGYPEDRVRTLGIPQFVKIGVISGVI